MFSNIAVTVNTHKMTWAGFCMQITCFVKFANKAELNSCSSTINVAQLIQLKFSHKIQPMHFRHFREKLFVYLKKHIIRRDIT